MVHSGKRPIYTPNWPQMFPNKDWKRELDFSVPQRCKMTKSKVVFGSEKTEVMSLRKMCFRSKVCCRVNTRSTPSKPCRKSAWFSRMQLWWALDSCGRKIPARCLEAVPNSIIALWFPHEELSRFSQIDAITDSHQYLGCIPGVLLTPMLKLLQNPWRRTKTIHLIQLTYAFQKMFLHSDLLFWWRTNS